MGRSRTNTVSPLGQSARRSVAVGSSSARPCSNITTRRFSARVTVPASAGTSPASVALPDDRFARATVRVALRQLQAAGTASAQIDTWLLAHDRLVPAEPEDPMEAVH